MARMITIERFLEQRDIDAALYLLSKMVGVESVSAEKLERLARLKETLEQYRHITPAQRREVVSSYREVVG